ncbi:MAG: hypothetical protein GX862_03220, partial [Leucobacter sp.]|nr:hypothetical protein [Leucobacter sp.]
VTITLLVLGGYFAMSSAFSMMTLGQSLTEIAVNAFQIENFVLPSSITTIGTVGAITLLALYAVVLIFSIRRMRARKLTFWAPLAAGALAMIVMFALFAIALSQSPELLHAGTQPEAMQQMLDYAESQGL